MNTIRWKALLGAAALAAGACTIAAASSAAPHETMTDRCMGEVAFPPSYDANPTAPGTVVLKRDASGYSPWTSFRAQTSGDGHVRWYCHSTLGNAFDPGTWRVHFNANAGQIEACLVSIGAAVATEGAGTPGAVMACQKLISITTSDFHGWTPERSRCGDRSKHFRARLGPNRLLETECLGR